MTLWSDAPQLRGSGKILLQNSPSTLSLSFIIKSKCIVLVSSWSHCNKWTEWNLEFSEYRESWEPGLILFLNVWALISECKFYLGLPPCIFHCAVLWMRVTIIKAFDFLGPRTVLECGLLPLNMSALVNLKKQSSPKVTRKAWWQSHCYLLEHFLARLGETKCFFGLLNGETVSCKIPMSPS